MKRRGSAAWRGDLKTGGGEIWTQSGVIKDTKYSFGKRFEDEPGTNPEELIGAAHAACYSMAFSANLGEAGFEADSIRTTATVTLSQEGGGFAITEVHLDVKAQIPGIDDSTFRDIAAKTKTTCPVSQVLKARITMDAVLD